LIQAADWRAVSIVHRVSIPPEIKMALDSFAQKGLLVQPTTITSRSSPAKSISSVARRNSGATTPSKSNILSAKAMNTPIQGRGRSLQATDVGANLTRSSSTSMISSSVPSSMDRSPATRKKASTTSERRIDGTQSAQSSPIRKPTDIENPVTPRRMSSARRPTVTPATTSVSVSKIVADSRSQSNDDSTTPLKFRASIPGPVDSSALSTDQVPSFIIPRTSKNEDDCGASSSSGSSGGRSSLTDNTVTSDGGFTDYLSDESEAELQRQAEEKAALFAQMQAEELEFKMARQQLVQIGLRPPKSWNPINASSAPLPSNTFPPPRNSVTTAPSFGAAVAVMVEGAQARG
jgi:hypothetical protein